MTHPTKPLDIEAEAHEILLKHTDTAVKAEGKMYNTVQTSEALAALSELLTRLREVEGERDEARSDVYDRDKIIRDLLSKARNSQALLEECKEALNVATDLAHFCADEDGTTIQDKALSFLDRAASLIEKLEGK